jgi:serpin B
VEGRTKERIKDLIPALKKEEGELVRMILVNAIYFKGQWTEPFEKRWTKEQPFHLADGSKTQVDLMHLGLTARYAAFNGNGVLFDTPVFFNDKGKSYPDADGFLMAELPYKGNRLAMVLIAPQNPKGLPALEAKLTGDTLTRWMSQMQNRVVLMRVPKFKLETEYQAMAKSLKEMGMKLALDGFKADFSGMTNSSNAADRLHISKVIHKAFVEVNEEGTEAAAATAVLMSVVPTSAAPAPRFNPEFRADRPFLFLIREVDTGAILFMGRMTTPAK